MGTKSLGPPFTVRVPRPHSVSRTLALSRFDQLSSGTDPLCVCVVHSQDNLQITLGTDKIGGGSVAWLIGLEFGWWPLHALFL